MGSKKKQAQAAKAALIAAATAGAAKNNAFLPDITFVSEILSSGEVTSSSQRIGWQISKHNIPNIWMETQGEGVTIAVLDTGVDVNHPDLANSISKTWSVINHNDNAADSHGHGTHCSGIITANNNTIGMVGVAPQTKIIAIKVLGDDGSGTMAGVAAGIRFAIDNKADIISMSLGGPEGDPVLHDAIKEAYNKNIPIICAAGNSGDRGTVAYPARYPETIAIGALNYKNLRAEFSQTGTKLDFMAPGVDILSTYIGGYRVLSGTSMATPWVAGVVALMIAKHRKIGGQTPLHTVENVREHLSKTALDLETAGKDNKTGFGLIDVKKALEQIKAPVPEPDPQPDPQPEPIGEPPMSMEALITKITEFTAVYDTKVVEQQGIDQQIADLQAQKNALTTEMNEMKEKSNQIQNILSA